MPWARIDDQANSNPKLLVLSDGAYRLFCCGLVYCQGALTDGFIPEHAIQILPVRARKAAAVEELTKVLVPGRKPLWHRVAGGYQVNDYLDWNDSRERVLLNRVTGKQRMALFKDPELRQLIRDRDGDICRYCGRVVRWNDRKGDIGGTYDHVEPYGGNSLENLVVACRGCNSKKLGRTPDEAGMPLLPPKSSPRSKSGSSPQSNSGSKSEQATTTTSTPSTPSGESSGEVRTGQSPIQRRAARAALSDDLQELRDVQRLQVCCSEDLIKPLVDKNISIPERDTLIVMLRGHVETHHPDMAATDVLYAMAVDRTLENWSANPKRRLA